jgi:hypothetical protein
VKKCVTVLLKKTLMTLKRFNESVPFLITAQDKLAT